jgi:hypothetical protein
MPAPWIRGFIWDDENLAHIARHGVWPDEVEEALVEESLVLVAPTTGTSPMGARSMAGGCSSCT